MFKNNTYRLNTVFHTLLLVFGLLFATSLIVARQPAPTATAAPSTYLNFQARLKTSSGSVVPDGFYNIEFKLYDASSGGSALWTETRTGANVVRVANGYFTVSLGSVTAFPGSIDWSQQHWITMNIGGTGSPTWDGEMNPRLLLTAVPHAFHADRASALSDGTNDYTHNDFIKIAPGALQGTASTASAIRINQTGSGGLLQLQSAGSDVFTISNSGQTTVRNTSSSAFRVQNGAGTTSTLLVDTTNNRVGIGTDSIGSGIDLQVGNSSGNVHVALAPANNGTSIIDFDGGSGANNIVYEDADGRISMRANGGALQVNYEGVRINRNLYIGTESGTDTLLVLDNKTTSGDVAGATNGAMYYNVDAGKFRCYEGGVWKDCISTSNIGDITQGGNSFGATMAIGTNDEEDLVLKTNGSSRLTIGSDGVATFSGSVVAGSFTGSGSLLTNLDASNISTGTLAIARGGTGATTAQGAMNVLSGLTTQGDLLYHNGTNSTRLARGTNGQCLTSDATTILWGSCGITSIGTFSTVNTSATGATLSGSQIVFQAASATAPGMVSIGSQEFSGNKTFNGIVALNGNSFGVGLSVTNAALFNNVMITKSISMGQSETGDVLTVGRKTSAGDPAGTNGAMYYNTTANKFRCYEGGIWKDCISTSNVGDITQGGNDLGGSTAMTIGTINNGGLNLMTNNQTRIAIASNGTISASGNLLPSTNDTYSLGSDTSRWADLYVGSSTLHIGESLSDEGTISYDAANSNLVLGATNGVNVRSASNSTTAFQIQNAIGTALLKADTTNSLVEVGNDGNVAIEGGDIWTARTAAEANQWTSITYGNGLFVAVANNGTNQVMTSPDGITWTPRTAAEANLWTSITYGNGLFVAVSWNGTNRVMTSPDGITWTPRTAAESNSWYSVTYGNGLFVAVAYSGTNRVMTSPVNYSYTTALRVTGGSQLNGSLSVAGAISATNGITIGNGNGSLLVLDNKVSAGDPAGTNGAMYYNTTANKFRCYEGGAWKDCITTAGFSSIGAIDSVAKSANGASVSGDSIILQTADETNPGLVSTGTQAFAGDKTFNGGVEINGADSSTGDAPLALKVQGGSATGSYTCSGSATCGYQGGGLSMIAGQGTTGLDGGSSSVVMGGAGGEIFIEGGAGGDVSGVYTMAGSGGDVVIQGGASGSGGLGASGNVYLARDRGSVYVGGRLNITGLTKLGTLGTASSTHLCYITSGADAGTVSTCSSSQRYKHNIQTADWGLDAIRQLRPVTFNWNEDGRDGFGFIAEEAYAINPLFAYSHNGQIEGVNYSELTSVLASGVQQLDVVVQAEKTRLDGVVNASQMQQATLSNLMAGMNGLEASISQVQSQITNATFATLNISGSASIQNLQVVNNLTVGNNLTVVNRISTRHLTVSGHIRTIGNAPTAELGILFDVLGQSIDVESAGISIEVAGNDTSGSIRITTGSEALHLDGSYLLQVNFDQAFDTQPRVILAAANTAAAQARLHLDNALVTNQYFRILTLEELAPNTVYELNYFIVE